MNWSYRSLPLPLLTLVIFTKYDLTITKWLINHNRDKNESQRNVAKQNVIWNFLSVIFLFKIHCIHLYYCKITSNYYFYVEFTLKQRQIQRTIQFIWYIWYETSEKKTEIWHVVFGNSFVTDSILEYWYRAWPRCNKNRP